ncbi:MAG: NAD+ synthase [Acidobacteriaceae bacterium]
MRIALAQLNPTVGDFSGNLKKIKEFVERAAAESADLVVFPELATCGYPPADLLEKEVFVRQAEQTLAELAKLTRGSGPGFERPAVLCGSPMHCQSASGKRIRNVAALLEDGEIKFVQEKMLLPFYDVFDEQRYFEPARQQTLALVKGQAVAITVCEDAWNDKLFWPRQMYPMDPIEELMRQWEVLPQPLSEPRLMLNISASPFWHGKRELRRRMIGALARRHRATLIMVNQVGANDSLIFDGASFAVGPDGEVFAEARSFEEDLLLIDTQANGASQPRPLGWPGTGLTGKSVPGDIPQSHRAQEKRALDIGLPESRSHDSPPPHHRSLGNPTSDWGDAEPRASSQSEERVSSTWQALVLGTHDYLHKCGFRKAIVGLSGGIDSALVATIAVAALGADNVQGVGMPSEFSSSGSVADAEKLAKNLGIGFTVVPIRSIYQQYLGSLQPAYQSTGAQSGFGLAEENLQPRIRGALLMALSNKTGALVLTTGNKSEMACGYCTLYGDMVGALAVIGDLYKTEVYELCQWLNREQAVIPEDTLTKPPSAELRPGQKDTDSLPPYDLLDPVLKAYIEEYSSAEEIAQSQGLDLQLVRRVIRLVELSEYKRKQAAPVLKVSRKSFGMGRRFPIAARREV